jgi:glycosyltransferase involved in cell wall biosynthesis
MRVVHVNGYAHPVGGAETYMLALIEAQAATGDDVGLLHNDAEAAVPAGVSARRADASTADLRWVESLAPDVVHLHDWSLPVDVEREVLRRFPVVRALPNYYFSSASAERWFRDGTVCTRPHGPGCLANLVFRGCAHRLDLRPALAHYRRISQRLPLVRATPACVVASEFVRSIAIVNGVPPERCHAIPYFAERVSEQPASAETRDVAFVGRITRNKGLDVLIRALSACAPDWDRLIVVGDGWHRPDCEELASRLGIRDRTDFLGWRPARAVRDVLRRACVLALPSRWPEPFGIVGIEAMACSRPVVATRIGGIPEWLDDGETGLLVPPGDVSALADALATVLRDPALAARLGREGWRRVGRFSRERHVAKLQAVYSAVAGATGGGDDGP